ncbi:MULTISPECIES: hypothetical protein [Klebsiella]|mgnify:CR=1 FL=1|uniref:hypothetical protein n=1 Tax=Klebsiella TaxID=570 RepID=UPI0015EFC7CD|nr:MULTISPECIES: hypothetical protein [Klebsiella]EKV5144335.1 hypothetical protein [Klebsiella michiganensis]EKW0785221.1 hypothetical protein [Klebsiella michiganensis]MBA4427218.1 hypothetical protein [Klebsiella michiganensis]MDX6056713.1 hypothetical protein [Klebsiella sp. JN_Kp126]UIU16524.1 hypothetical protein LLZ89_20230 [Klebsiella michiganensis]
MTNNQLTREENVQAVFDLKAGYKLGLADVEILKRVARMMLAAMDSEPVAWIAIYHGEVYDEAIGITRSVVEAQADHFGWESALTEIIPLYRHAQQPVVPDRSIFEKWWESQNGAPLDGWDSLRTTDGYCDDGIDGQFEAWNAATLAAAPQEVPDGK